MSRTGRRRIYANTLPRFLQRIAILLAGLAATVPMVAQALSVNHFPTPATCPIQGGRGISGAAIHPDGTVYLPCGDGLLKIVYNPPAAPVETFISQIAGVTLYAIDVAFDGNGILWLVGNSKITRVDLGANAALAYTLPAAQGNPSRLLIGADNQVWFLNNGNATFGRLDPGTGAITALQSPSGAKLTDFALAPDGHVWYGSYDSIVGEVLPDNTIREWPVSGGNYIPSLVFDAAGQLWGSSGGGVARWVNNDWENAPAATPALSTFVIGLTRAPDGVVWQYGFVYGPGNDENQQRWMVGTVGLDGGQTQTTVVPPAGRGTIAWARFRPNDGALVFFDTNGFVKLYGFVQPYARTPTNTTVTEFYNVDLDHYFITANVDEATAIDTGSAGPGWSRTGMSFKAWLGGPIPGAAEVCRFYGTPGSGPNSHFYTTIREECVLVKQDTGWTYEALGRFWLVQAIGNTPAGCPAGTQPIYRTYNNRFAQNDSNHRYATDVAVYNVMVGRGWSGEGVVMCAPV